MFLHFLVALGFLNGFIHAATNVGGVLLTNTIWSNTSSANLYRLISNVQIPRNVTLIIQAGVTVKFDQGDFEMFVKGSIQILGTSGKPVIFEDGSASDLKYMISFGSTQLSQSAINFAQFRGPKKAI